MNKRKRKLKKFRKKNVIVPILGFLLLIVFILLIEIFIISVEMTSTLENKMRATAESANFEAEKVLDSISYMDEDTGTVLSSYDTNMIVKKGKELLYSNCGEKEFDKIHLEFIGESKDLYFEKHRKDDLLKINKDVFYINEKNRLEFSVHGFTNAIRESMLQSKDKHTLACFNVWLKSDVMIDGGHVYVNKIIEITTHDIELSLVIIVVTVFFVIIVIIVMLGNVISSILINNRMLEALYFDDKTLGNNWLYFTTNATKIIRNRRYRYAVVSVKCCKYNHYCSCSGAEKGDEVLLDTYKDIKNAIMRREMVARNSDTNFGVLLKRKNTDDLHKAISYIKEGVEEQVFIGAYIIPEWKDMRKSKENIEDFYHFAKVACDTIKDSDKSEVVFFDDKISEEHMWMHEVEDTMEDALKNEEFKVFIQPKYSPKNSELKGAEALIRWISPKNGFISPGKFIPIFEENGFITKIDDYMISHVAKLQSEWIKAGYKVVPISVNVSRMHFINPHLAEHICKLVDKYNTPHEFIEIELTESAFFDDKRALLSTVDKLQGYGFHVSMDDFGAGYSSLNSLKDLPLNVLKLDAEFFRGESINNRGEVIVGKAIELAKELDMEIVAEGIEEKEQVEFLAKAGCDMIQGFYFDKPMPTNEYQDRMKKE